MNKEKCLICQDGTIDYYNIMKEFCSDMDKIADNICNDHTGTLLEKGLEFLNK